MNTTTARRIAVVSAGLSNPSSTRMLADRLAAATVARLAEDGIQATVDTVELRDLAHRLGEPVPAQPVVVAAVGGRVVAGLSVRTGVLVFDPPEAGPAVRVVGWSVGPAASSESELPPHAASTRQSARRAAAGRVRLMPPA